MTLASHFLILLLLSDLNVVPLSSRVLKTIKEKKIVFYLLTNLSLDTIKLLNSETWPKNTVSTLTNS